MNSNDNHVYVVQCTKDTLEDVRCILMMSVHVMDVDFENNRLKTSSICSLTKKRLHDVGASFWQEPGYTVAKAVAGRKF
jgi:sensor c-di-GMP phosphodiesterase-like protein